MGPLFFSNPFFREHIIIIKTVVPFDVEACSCVPSSLAVPLHGTACLQRSAAFYLDRDPGAAWVTSTSDERAISTQRSMYNQGQQQPQGADVNYLRGLFQNVDKNRSGAINARELQSALSNGTWKPFNMETVNVMIRMFDRQGRGSVSFDDFTSLWNFLTSWLNCFQSFDADRSGFIDRRELSEALTRFGYRLGQPTVDALVMKYDRDRKGSINFDDFILCCLSLQSLTDTFRRYDTDQDGIITIQYEEFIKAVIPLLA